MRDKRFKAWDKTNNEWYMGGDAFDLDFSGSYGDFFFDNDHPSNMRDVKLEWVQYTGLLDKNGKEIYEGDIVEQNVNCMFDKGKHKQEVSFNGKDQFVSGNCSLHQAIESFRAEVIGNIYENPKLLNI